MRKKALSAGLGPLRRQTKRDILVRLVALLLLAGVGGCGSAAPGSDIGTGGATGGGGAGGLGGGAGGAATDGGGNEGSENCGGDRPSGGCVGQFPNGVCYPDPEPFVCVGAGQGWICPVGTIPWSQCSCAHKPYFFSCPDGGASDDATTPGDVGGDGMPEAPADLAETGADGGRCGRTNLGATVTVRSPGGSVLSCNDHPTDAGFGSTPQKTWVGMVTGSDASSIVVSICSPGTANDDAAAADAGATDAGGGDAGCVPGTLRIEAVAPGLDLARFPQVWVRVKATVSFFWECQQSLEITTADPTDGSPRQGPAGQLLLAVVDGNGVAFADSPYRVAHVQLGCAPGPVCNDRASDADDYAFDFSSPGDTGAPTRVYMSETVTWKSAGANFTVRNLRSFQTSVCDDYWNWAYTIYADPK